MSHQSMKTKNNSLTLGWGLVTRKSCCIQSFCANILVHVKSITPEDANNVRLVQQSMDILCPRIETSQVLSIQISSTDLSNGLDVGLSLFNPTDNV